MRVNQSLLATLFFLSLASRPVEAQCPVCAVAVGAGLGLSRWLGIDDVISGLWVGAVLWTFSIWTINWLTKKKIKFLGRQPLVVALYYGLTLIPLRLWNIIGDPANQTWGFDKLVLGTVLGSLGFIFGLWLNAQLKLRNNNKAYFPFQKVVLPITPLIILSLGLYLL